MKRTFQLARSIVTLLTLAIFTTATAQSSSISREIRFSKLFPGQAAQYRERIRSQRKCIEGLIRQARAEGNIQKPMISYIADRKKLAF